MLKKLSQFFKSLFYKFNRKLPSDVLFLDQNGNYVTKDGIRSSKTPEELLKDLRSNFTEPDLESTIKQNQKNFGSVEQAVQMNLDTGKIIMPENMSPEDQAELEQALQEFKVALQGMTGDKFASLEEFINKSSSSLSIPFTTANNLPDAQLQIVEEFSNHEFDTQNWGDYDFVESLVGYENQGYEFVGLEQIYQKYAERRELTEEEAKKVREWYTLVSQELVYDV